MITDNKLYAFRPPGHGEYSFFVMAASEEDARAAVDARIATPEDYEYPSLFLGWPDRYEMTVAEAGRVLVNAND